MTSDQLFAKQEIYINTVLCRHATEKSTYKSALPNIPADICSEQWSSRQTSNYDRDNVPPSLINPIKNQNNQKN